MFQISETSETLSFCFCFDQSILMWIRAAHQLSDGWTEFNQFPRISDIYIFYHEQVAASVQGRTSE